MSITLEATLYIALNKNTIISSVQEFDRSKIKCLKV